MKIYGELESICQRAYIPQEQPKGTISYEGLHRMVLCVLKSRCVAMIGPLYLPAASLGRSKCDDALPEPGTCPLNNLLVLSREEGNDPYKPSPMVSRKGIPRFIPSFPTYRTCKINRELMNPGLINPCLLIWGCSPPHVMIPY